MSLLVIVAIILIFGFLVFVHELGHFVAARRAGVEVHEFGFGFPPKLIGKKVGRTEYSINWIPLGGFVRLKGENLTDKAPGSFGAASFSNKTKILFAGVTMNALVALLILVGLAWTGLPPIIQNQFSFGQPQYVQDKQLMAVAVADDSPAQKAGIERGDMILSGDGQRFVAETELLAFTKSHAGQKATFEVESDGRISVIEVELRQPDSGQGALGVTPFQTYKQQYGFIDGIVTAVGITGQLVIGTLSAFGNLVAGLVTKGQMSEQVAGPVGIVALLSNVLDFGLVYVLVFVVSISISLAVINALPLPALDGGRWLMAAAQKLTKRQLSERTEGLVHTVGFVALMLLMVVITYFDIERIG